MPAALCGHVLARLAHDHRTYGSTEMLQCNL